MKQVLQGLKSGATEVADVPCPAVGRGKLLIGTTLDWVRSSCKHGTSLSIDCAFRHALFRQRQA
ncbi:MAG: hypothetical protein IPN05_07930 [Sulfuritalea sp.]|nr:hypothetical protein [Sulfuritalea sp.]MBK9350109.1 hypothetical protein [Sulfuritalea sp.]